MASGTIATPQYTSTTSIEVTVTVQDADQVQLSNDGSTFGAWQSAVNNGKVPHTLSSGDGLKTVFAKFREAPNGTESDVVTAQTTLDTAAPTAALQINKGAPITASPSVTLSITASDPTTPVLIKLKNETGDYGPFEAATPEKAWSLTPGVGAKTVTMLVVDATGHQATASASIWLAQSGGAKWLILKTPDYDDTAEGIQTSYLREGGANSAEENDLLNSHGGAPYADAARSTQNGVTRTFDGWFEYTDGVRTEVTRGDRVEITGGSESAYVKKDQTLTVGRDHTINVSGKRVDNIGGEYRINVGGNADPDDSDNHDPGATVRIFDSDPIYYMEFNRQDGIKAGGKPTWRKTIKGHVAADTYLFGDTENFFGGYKFDGTFGLSSSMFVGGKLDLSAAISASASLGYTFAYTKAVNLTAVDGKDLRTVGNHDLKARSSIRLRVQGKHPLGAPQWSKVWWSLGALGVGTLGAIVATSVSATHGELDTSEKGAESPGTVAGLSVAAASFGIGLILSVVWALKEAAGAVAPPEPPMQLKLTSNGVELAQHTPLGVMQAMLHVGNTGNAPAGAPGQIWMGNAANCLFELATQGRLHGSAPTEVAFATTDGTASLSLVPNQIRMQAPQLVLNGQQVNMNNVLQVLGAPPPVILGNLAPPPPIHLAPGEIIMDDDL